MASAMLGPSCRGVGSGFRSCVFLRNRKARRSYTVAGSLVAPLLKIFEPVSLRSSTNTVRVEGPEGKKVSSIEASERKESHEEWFARKKESPMESSEWKKESSVEGPKWKKVSSVELGITDHKFSKPVRFVLNQLKKKGYQVYLVGGCVRDLVLKRIPKDFDIITTANLHEVKRTFSRCRIVGVRFPICLVHVDDSVVEVSSFDTSAKKSPKNLTSLYKKPVKCDEQDYMRWSNCLKRDFTINGLMFDPYEKVVYDYAGGFEDIKRAKVRTVIDPDASFEEDCARILRGIRIAARLNFRLTKETALAIQKMSYKVLHLDKARLQMEMNYMLGYGSAEASLRLLWKAGILELLLPVQAAYFASQGFRRRDKRSNMLLCLFSNLDKLLAPDRPCHCSLWTSILALHHALSKIPRDPLVVATFAIAIHYGGKVAKAAAIARQITYQYDDSFPELTEPSDWESDSKLVNEVMDLAAAVDSSLNVMTDEYYISQAMAKYPQAPKSNLVLVSVNIYLKVRDIISCIRKNSSNANFTAKQGNEIDYENLLQGDTAELRHVFARVVFDTIYPVDAEEKDNGTEA